MGAYGAQYVCPSVIGRKSSSCSNLDHLMQRLWGYWIKKGPPTFFTPTYCTEHSVVEELVFKVWLGLGLRVVVVFFEGGCPNSCVFWFLSKKFSKADEAKN